MYETVDEAKAAAIEEAEKYWAYHAFVYIVGDKLGVIATHEEKYVTTRISHNARIILHGQAKWVDDEQGLRKVWTWSESDHVKVMRRILRDI